MAETIFISLKESETKCLAFLKRQGSAATITLMGPTSSAKSTLVTEMVHPTSNRLLGKNVGDTAQTSLIRTLLMLNGRLSTSDVLLQCIPHEEKEMMLLKFLATIRTETVEAIYKMRDELDDFKVNDNFVAKILNPIDRSYHAFEFAKEHNLVESLESLLNEFCTYIIREPEVLDDAANLAFKERKKTQTNIKKIDIYEELIEERFNNNSKIRNDLSIWFKKLETEVYLDLEHLWTFASAESYIVLDHITENSPANELVEKLYSKNSACSLIFQEIRYVTSPSDSFRDAFRNSNTNMLGRNVKLNILDTVGLTQSSQERDVINDEIDRILQRDTDALLFLCASDEQPTIYETCISLLHEKNKKLANKPVVICRTKADITILNIMANRWRKDTGMNSKPEGDKFKEYVTNAFNSYINDYIDSNNFDEAKLGKVEYLSLLSFFSDEVNEMLDKKLHSSKAFEILLGIVGEIDELYSDKGERQWFCSKDLEHTPLTLNNNTQHLTKTIATALTAYNTKQNNQYMQYSKSKEIYHGRSVNCFWDKLSYGEGHETKALYYGNFKLYIKNMVARWLRELVPINNLVNDFDISQEYLAVISESSFNKAEYLTKLRELIKDRWWTITDNVAKKLSYDCLQPELNNCFHYYSWDTGFRYSLNLINNKFSLIDYWNENLIQLIEIEVNAILQKMYIFDEV